MPLPEHMKHCRHIKSYWRRQFCGCMVGIDDGIRNLTSSIIELLGNDTIFIVSSDNGGSTWFGGLNEVRVKFIISLQQKYSFYSNLLIIIPK
jgi:hypothetical protein